MNRASGTDEICTSRRKEEPVQLEAMGSQETELKTDFEPRLSRTSSNTDGPGENIPVGGMVGEDETREKQVTPVWPQVCEPGVGEPGKGVRLRQDLNVRLRRVRGQRGRGRAEEGRGRVTLRVPMSTPPVPGLPCF